MRCFIYKSLRKADSYVFLRERDGFAILPAPIADSLGAFVFVMEIELTPGQKLAREPAAVVIDHLERKGFHLQLPLHEPTLLSRRPE
jgi:uncharacterized protein YcgL (UPF0745 family)